MKKKEILVIIIVLVFFLLVSYFAQQYSETLKELIELKGSAGMALYTLGAVIATVIAPLSFLPFLPLAVAIWGSLIAAILSIIGWTVGAVIAFVLARRYGHPLVCKIIGTKKIEQFENFIPAQNLFWSVVFLRIALPVDLLSYALGLFTTMRFVPYLFATLIGVTPFAFAFAYLSTVSVLFQITALTIGLVVIFFGYSRFKRRYLRRKSQLQ